MDHSKKLLTISIAAYNVESSLERALRSLTANADLMSRLDIIIVDDGSTDATTLIAEKFSSKYKNSVRLIRKANGGYGSTVNTAIKVANGTYFKLLDGDDEFDPKGLRCLLEIIDTQTELKPDIIISPFVYADRSCEKHPHDTRKLCDRHKSLQTESVRIEDAYLSDGLMMFEMCVRTEILQRSGLELTENCYYTDNEYVMAAELYADTVIRCPMPVYIYSIGISGQSMSIEGRRCHLDDKIIAARGVYAFYDSSYSRTRITGSRKLITDKLISTMTREIYVSAMLQEDPLSYRDVLRRWDVEVSGRWPYIFGITDQSRLVRAVRRSGDAVYRLLCRKVLRSEMKRTVGSIGSKQNRNAASVAEYITAACMIVQCRTVYLHLQDWGMVINRAIWVIMMVAMAACIYLIINQPVIDQNHKITDRRTLLFCIGLMVYTAVFLSVNPVNQLRVIRCSGAVLLMLLLTGASSAGGCSLRILKCFRNLMVIIAAISIFCWVTVSIANIFPFTGTVYMDWSATQEYTKINSFLGIYYETQWTDFTLIPARNCGIFVEGPMAGFAYALALILEIFFSGIREKADRLHVLRTVILSAAILSTLSIIIYGALFLIFILNLIMAAFSGKKVRKSGKIILAVFIAVCTVLMAHFIIHKLSLPDGNTRINDFIVGFDAWLAHPFFGGGFESLEYLQQFMPPWRLFDTGFSNSPMEILAQGGIYLAAPYVYAFISSILKALRTCNLSRLTATVAFAYLFMFIVVPYQYITFYMLIMLTKDGQEIC